MNLIVVFLVLLRMKIKLFYSCFFSVSGSVTEIDVHWFAAGHVLRESTSCLFEKCTLNSMIPWEYESQQQQQNCQLGKYISTLL